jgi:transcription termination factor Rho
MSDTNQENQLPLDGTAASADAAEAAAPKRTRAPRATATKTATKTRATKSKAAAAATEADSAPAPEAVAPRAESTPEAASAPRPREVAVAEAPPVAAAPAIESTPRTEGAPTSFSDSTGPAPMPQSTPNAPQARNGAENYPQQNPDNFNGESRMLARGGLRFRGRDGRVEGRPDGGQGRPEGGGNFGQHNPNQHNQGGGGRRDRRGRLKGRDRNQENYYPKENGFYPEDAVLREGGRRNEFEMVTLEGKPIEELREIASTLEVEGAEKLSKDELVFKILEAQAAQSGHGFKRGNMEILPDGKGFMRCEGYLPGSEDVYVSQSQIKRFNLKTGDMVAGQVRAPKDMERYWGLLRVEAINGEPTENLKVRKDFEKLTPIFPDEKFNLETTQENITARIIDLVTPIGKGQRGLIVAPPKAGKTSLIKNIANSIVANHPDIYLIILLIDERPEEVTDISRSVRGEVVASTFDELPENHIRVADMALEKAKRLVEMKRDVVILLDSITRLSRASNLVCTPSGRTMSGGLDPAAMYKPKRLFGAARNIEEGGSLTILATVLIDTGSRMDEYIFEELKGTGNLDLVLDRSLFDQRIFPAIDINKSGTRRDDLLLSKEDLAAVFHLRRTLAALDNDKAVTLLIDRLKNTKTNHDFMQIVQKSSAKAAQ